MKCVNLKMQCHTISWSSQNDGISVERLMSSVDIINSIVSKDTDRFCSWLSSVATWYSNKRIIFNRNDISYVIKKINQEL